MTHLFAKTLFKKSVLRKKIILLPCAPVPNPKWRIFELRPNDIRQCRPLF